MARFSEDSPDTVPLHEMGKSWSHVYVDAEGGVNLQKVSRTPIGTLYHHPGEMRMTPQKADLLVKALKRAIKEAKRK
jgi:hypothetical protein